MLSRGLYGVADPTWGDPLDQVRRLATAGVGTVQIRCKGWATGEVVALARRCPVPLVVNDDIEAARQLGVWVHLGQDDGPDPDVPFGRSTHTLEQALAAGTARYIGFGPVFATGTKNTGYAPRGVELLAEVVARSAIPVIAIGGIHMGNVAAVRATGAWGWAAIAGVWGSPDPDAAMKAMGSVRGMGSGLYY